MYSIYIYTIRLILWDLLRDPYCIRRILWDVYGRYVYTMRCTVYTVYKTYTMKLMLHIYYDVLR